MRIPDESLPGNQPARDPAPIKFMCPSCQAKLQAKAESAGKLLRCPKCGQKIKASNQKRTIEPGPSSSSETPIGTPDLPLDRGSRPNSHEGGNDVHIALESVPTPAESRSTPVTSGHDQPRPSQPTLAKLDEESVRFIVQYSAENLVVHIGETVWVVNPRLPSSPGVSSDLEWRYFYVPEILRQLGFPGERNCWRCTERAAEVGSEIIEEVAATETRSTTSGGMLIRTMSGYVCVPRCRVCQQIEREAEGMLTIPEIVCYVAFSALVLLILFGFIRGFERAQEDIRPDWVFSVPMSVVFVLGAVLGAVLFAGLIWRQIVKRRARTFLISKGLRLEMHPDVQRAAVFLNRLVKGST